MSKDPETTEVAEETTALLKTIEDFMESKADEMGLNAAKHVALKAEPEEEKEEETVEEKAMNKSVAWVKAWANRDMAMIKDLSEGTDTEGGFLVPEEFRAELLRLVEDFGLVRSTSRVLPMNSDTLLIPSLTTQPTVSWPGEGNAATASDPVFGQITLSAKTVVGLTVTSNELIQDSRPSVINILTELMAEQIAGAEDEQGLVGTGAPFTGILNDAGVNTVTMAAGNVDFSDIGADDLADMIDAVKTTAQGGAVFVMHRNILANVRKLKDGAGAYIFDPSAATPEGVVGSIWGYPILTSDKMPGTAASAVSTEFVIFGNMRNLLLGDRQQVTMSISDSAVIAGSSTFERNQSAVRFTERVALAVGIPEAFAVLVTAAV